MCTCVEHYARVICPTHGNRHLNRDAYIAELEKVDQLWECPTCGQPAEFDEAHFWQTHGEE